MADIRIIYLNTRYPEALTYSRRLKQVLFFSEI